MKNLNIKRVINGLILIVVVAAGVILYSHKDIFLNKENEFQWQGITAISAFLAFVVSLWSNYKTRELNRKTIKANYLFNNRLKIIGDIQSDFAEYVLTSNDILKKKEIIQENTDEMKQIQKEITDTLWFDRKYADKPKEIVEEAFESSYIDEYGNEQINYSPVTAETLMLYNESDRSTGEEKLGILKSEKERLDSDVKLLLKNLRGIKIQLSLKCIKDEEIAILTQLEKHNMFITKESYCEMQVIELECLIDTFKLFLRKNGILLKVIHEN